MPKSNPGGNVLRGPEGIDKSIKILRRTESAADEETGSLRRYPTDASFGSSTCPPQTLTNELITFT